MTKIKIDDLPQALAQKKISKTEAVNIIWEELYTHPFTYGLIHFTEDQKSDFLLGMHDIFMKIFEKYNPGTISFQTFITGCIAKYKLTFLRKQTETNILRKSVTAYLAQETEEKTYSNRIELTEPVEEETSERKNFSDVARKKQGFDGRWHRVAELTALVLMMKACRDIDDGTINSVSKFTGIDKTLLYEKIQQLKESMQEKESHSLELIAKRNNAYFFHRKYLQQMTAKFNTDERLRELKERYEKHTRKWHIHNKALSVRSMSPSNEEIAKILGIKPRTVSFYINHAKIGKTQQRLSELKDERNMTEKERQKLAQASCQETEENQSL